MTNLHLGEIQISFDALKFELPTYLQILNPWMQEKFDVSLLKLGETEGDFSQD
jgi:hypothetical protein